MAATIPLIELSALPAGRGRRVCKAGLDLALFKIGDADYAIEESCPHNGGSLSNGKLQGTADLPGARADVQSGKRLPARLVDAGGKEARRARRGRHGDADTRRSIAARPFDPCRQSTA